jgi:4-hydroxyphenylacetate 3-monooxygenase
MALRTGRQYRNSLLDGRQIIYDGAAVNVLKHPRFRKSVNLVSQFYDFQNADEQRDIMSFETSDHDRVGMAFLEARSKEDLHKKAAAYSAWARITCGTMGRSPDYMNTCVASVYGARVRLARIDAKLGRRAESTYHDLRRKDLCLTHTFGSSRGRDGETSRRFSVQTEKPDGSLVVNGARGIATLAPFANVNLNLDLGVIDGMPYSYSFFHKVSLRGLRWICREFVSPDSNHAASPLASRADEMDAIPIFQKCTLSHKGLFGYFHSHEAFSILGDYEPLFVAGLQHHVIVRSIHKTRFLLGLAHLMAQSSSMAKTAQIGARLGEIVQGLLILEALAFAAVENAIHDPDTGAFHPNPQYALCGLRFSGELHSKIAAHIEDMGASRLLSVPHKATLDIFGAAIEQFYRGGTDDGAKQSQLLRLAWDVTGSEWAARQLLYERFHFGPAEVHYANTYRLFDKTEAISMATHLIEKGPDKDKVFPQR